MRKTFTAQSPAPAIEFPRRLLVDVDRAPAGARLHAELDRATADVLQRPRDGQPRAQAVETRPFEADDLAAPHAGVGGEMKRDAQRTVARGGEERSHRPRSRSEPLLLRSCRIGGSADRLVVRGCDGSASVSSTEKGSNMASTDSAKPLPDEYRRVTPTLVVDGAAKALELYAELFGATERVRFPGPDGSIVHSEIEIGDSVIMVDDASPIMGTKAPPTGGLDGTPTSLYIYVEDVDAIVERAYTLGATVRRRPEDQFYGDRNAWIVDPFGHHWVVATHVEDVTPEEMTRRMTQLFGES
jgi:PhnB protein